jgi:hypothetical protein
MFHDFAKWTYFATDTIQENVRDEPVKIIKYNHLIANLLIFHNVYSMTQVLNELESQGVMITPEMLSVLNPFWTGHINRLGIYEVRDREMDGGEVGGGDLAGVAGQLARVLPDGDGVQVDDAIDAIVRLLERDEILDRA